MKRLKITHINTLVNAGGAAKSTMRLAALQRALGHDAHVLAGNPVPRGEYIHGFDPAPQPELIERCKKKGELYYEYQGSHRLVTHELVPSSDIVHFSNLHGSYFNPWSISALSHSKPVVWTLRDMQSITGYCAHSLNCEKWRTGCGNCPDLNIYPTLTADNTAQLIRDKHYIYENSYLQIVTPSDWLRKKLQHSILRDHPVELIYNGCDTNIFKPYSKAQIRQRLGIPQNAFVVGAVAHGGVLANSWKGGKYTQAAWEILRKLIPNSIFLNIGAETKSEDPTILNVLRVPDESQLAQLYNALDVFLYTSIADTCPLVVIETLACGVPIVTFDTGGIPELVRDKTDGFVFRQGDTDSLVCAVKAIYDNKPLAEMMKDCARSAAVERFSIENTTRRYIDLYHRCIERHKIQKGQVKYFDMNRVPDIIKTPDFLNAEKSKDKTKADSSNIRSLPAGSNKRPIISQPDGLTYSRLSHFTFFKAQQYDVELFGKKIDVAVCDLKMYQDFLVLAFIKAYIPKGSRILDVGGGDSRILKHFCKDYECWNIDPLDGSGSGLTALSPQGRYRLVRDYMGNFNRQLPDDYFDFVFSISALEHVPHKDPALLEKVRDDINRVLKPGGFSLHCFDVVMKKESVWTNSLLPFLFETQQTLNHWTSLESLRSEPDLYTMTETAYNHGWKNITKEPYEQFGKPLSYNVLWQKAPVGAEPRRHVAPVRDEASTSCPRITVVTPSFNQAKYLEACIESVLSQNYPNLEYIIMDGGSTDGSVEIIKKYEKYLAYWQSCPDGGQYKAVEEGFRRSTGQILTWLNSDDMFFPNAFESAAAIFSHRREIEWITGKTVNFKEDGSIHIIVDKLPLWSRKKYLKKEYREPYLQQEGTFWRRSLWERVGAGMNPQVRLAGDMELWTRFFRHAELYSVEATLAGYRLQPSRKIATLLDKYHEEADHVLDQEIADYMSRPDKPALPSPPAPISADLLKKYIESFRDQSAGRKSACPTAIPLQRTSSRQESQKSRILLATSLAPGNLENQQRAVESWLAVGFEVISVNNPDEIENLRPHFQKVRFVTASRNGREHYGKPLVYIDDILGALKASGNEIVGLINSDIHLRMNPDYMEFIRRQADGAMVCVNRINVDAAHSGTGDVFSNGFDVFFFHRNVIDRISLSRFCLGVAWYDYFIPMNAILNQIPLVRLQEAVAYHVKHQLNWDLEKWIHAGMYYFERLLQLRRNNAQNNQFYGLDQKLQISQRHFYKTIRDGFLQVDIRQAYAFAEFILGLILGNARVVSLASTSASPEPRLSNQDKPVGPEAVPAQPLNPLQVSAIVSTYNSESFIRGCLQDLVEQTLCQKGQLEIIIVNSGSQQNEEAIVKEYQAKYPHIQYIKTPQRESIYAAWNRGVQVAQGKYLTNANTDDRHSPQMLEKLAAALDQHPDIAAVYAQFYITSTPNQTWQTKTVVHVADAQPKYSRRELSRRNYMGPFPMWRKQLHEEYGYFDAAMKVAGDYEFFLRVSQTHNFMLIPELLGLYFYNPNSLERSAGTHEEEKQFTINLYDRFSSYNVRRPLPFPKPQFSVILRNENQGRRMEESIRTVLAQTRGDWELIIVDEASMDDSLAIIRRYCNDPRIRLIRHNCKALPADVAKEAIAAVNADLFGAINSGDVLAPDAIEQVVDAHERSPQNAWISFPQAHGLATGPFKSWKFREYINGKIQTPQRNQNSDDNAGSLAGRAVNLPIRKANPLVSVYMGAYNAQAYIRQAIESVLSQTFRDFELIVVDDGSTDRTVDVVESFKDSRIRLLRQEHKNFAAAMNTAISHARGEWIIGVDSDDDIEPDYLERMAGYALANPGFDYYYPTSLFLNDPQKQYSQDRWDYRDFEDNRNLPPFLLMNGFSPIPNAGSLKRAAMFTTTGLYRELDAVEDFDFLARNALKIHFKRADGIAGYHYRINPAGNCHKFVRRSQVTAEILDEMIRVYDSQVLCPPLDKIEPLEKEKKYHQYLLNVFHGLANRYSGRGGEVFFQYAAKYRTQSSKNQIQQACI